MKSLWLALTVLAALNVGTAAFANEEVASAEQTTDTETSSDESKGSEDKE